MTWKKVTTLVRIKPLEPILEQHNLGNDGDHSDCGPAFDVDWFHLTQKQIDGSEWNTCIYKAWQLQQKHRDGDHSQCIYSNLRDSTNPRWDACPTGSVKDRLRKWFTLE